MSRLESLASWFFTCLAITLLGGSILVVPQQAFADGYSDCAAACCTACFGGDTCDTFSSCYLDCTSPCFDCVTACKGDKSCEAACAAQKKACPQGCEVGVNCAIQFPNCDNSNTSCSKTAGTCDYCACKKVSNMCDCRLK